ncbi:MAG: hypothetical protein ACLQPH_20170 [Acidimicrobiales bacterium]
MFGPRTRPTRQQRLLRRFLPLVVGVVLLIWMASSVLAGGGSIVVTATTTTTITAPIATTTTTTTAPAVTTTTSGAGSLPQTAAFPSSTSSQFTAAMGDLFDAVAHGTPATAAGAFFPEAAYVQLKSIGDAAGDYQGRLLAEYDQDIMAANADLGPGAPAASLVSVDVPMQYAHWVPPGECENSVGYFEVANSRLVYSLGGSTRSFGIASLISWRGEWYVVHLGAILRSGSAGEVLDPVSGPGQSAPSTTC